MTLDFRSSINLSHLLTRVGFFKTSYMKIDYDKVMKAAENYSGAFEGHLQKAVRMAFADGVIQALRQIDYYVNKTDE